MNKAFVKEPDIPDPRCPAHGGCGGLGAPVPQETVETQLSAAVAARLSGSVYYCSSPSCDTAYFDRWGTAVGRDLLRTSAYPKDPGAPVCSCFGVMAEEVRREAEEGQRDLVRSLLARAESDDAKCRTRAPGGRCCVAEVRKLFLKHYRKAAT